jgi:hypothetical protein
MCISHFCKTTHVNMPLTFASFHRTKTFMPATRVVLRTGLQKRSENSSGFPWVPSEVLLRRRPMYFRYSIPNTADQRPSSGESSRRMETGKTSPRRWRIQREAAVSYGHRARKSKSKLTTCTTQRIVRSHKVIVFCKRCQSRQNRKLKIPKPISIKSSTKVGPWFFVY